MLALRVWAGAARGAEEREPREERYPATMISVLSAKRCSLVAYGHNYDAYWGSRKMRWKASGEPCFVLFRFPSRGRKFTEKVARTRLKQTLKVFSDI